MYLVVGLGNPDKKYANTMHNMGFMAVDKATQKLNLSFNKKAFKGVVCETVVNGNKVVFLKPYTYMNLSGDSVVEAVKFYKIPLSNLIVVYDDIDVEKGRLRLREKGSAGTHNGMRDVILKLGSGEFFRVRIGIKNNNFAGSLADYVLSQIKSEEKEVIETSLTRASEAIIDFVSGISTEEAMRKYNG